MPRSYVRLTFDNDDDGTGKLLARAEARGFAGEGGAHFSIPQLEAFAASLLAFPLPSDTSPSIAGGFWSNANRGELDQEHLAIGVYPLDKTGHLGVQVRMATQLWQEQRPQSQSATKLELVTTYEALARFSHAITALVRGTTKEAILEGEDLD
jgi:hypothetical protein